MREPAVEFSAFEQRFRWDAAPFQTNAAQMALFYDGSPQAQLRRSDCGYISPGPAPSESEVTSIEKPSSAIRSGIQADDNEGMTLPCYRFL